MGDTTEELCQRWMQLGAFYPFSRNHNNLLCVNAQLKCKDQDPAAFSKAMQDSTRSVLLTRYRLLPYLYTLFHKAHAIGSTVARPLFFEFPSETALYSVQTQFMWGDALMISPVLTEGAIQVDAVIPKGLWYDYYTGASLSMSSTQSVTLKAPLDTINLHVRSGHMLVMQEPNTTTTASRKNKFGLIVPLMSDGTASGDLYWDDGDTLSTFENDKYIYLSFAAHDKMVLSLVTHDGYPDSSTMMLGTIVVFGVNTAPTSVTMNGKVAAFKYDSTNKVLNVSSLNVALNTPFKMTWV